MSTVSERRRAVDQSLASTRLEGHVPTSEFLADCEAVAAGSMTGHEARARSLARVLEEQRRLLNKQGQ